MNPLVFHIVSGQAFFTGVMLLVISAAASMRTHAVFRRVTIFCFLLGMAVVVISSTAVPVWCCVLSGVSTSAWLVTRFRNSRRRIACAAFIFSWVMAAAIEVPYHITPTLRRTTDRSVTVIGDSVTAGIGGNETAERWPQLLAAQRDLSVQDISNMGETAGSALQRAKPHVISSSIVCVEIGGNDVLGNTTAAQFERDLDALLKYLKASNRQLVMFELPLPPFYHRFGYIQRRLAAKYETLLIPKRVFLSVIAGSDSTLDTIHLSQTGHQKMADTVWEIISSAFDDVP